MRHEHLVVTVDAETKERVDEELEPGESLEAWVADAIERKLAADEGGGEDPERGESGTRWAETAESDGEGRESDADARESGGWTRTRPDAERGSGESSGERDDEYDGDDYDEGFEFVDDCSI